MAPAPVPLEVPDVDLWTFLFERKEKPFSDDQVIYRTPQSTSTSTSNSATKNTLSPWSSPTSKSSKSPTFATDPETSLPPSSIYTYLTTRLTASAFGASLLQHYAFIPGTVLALFTPNSIHTPAITWGTHWAGGVLAPANPGYTIEELVVFLKDCGARVVVAGGGKEKVGMVRRAVEVVGGGVGIVVVEAEEDGQEDESEGRVDGVRMFREVVKKGAEALKGKGKGSGVQRVKRESGDLAFLVYSSGTTGKPKGVMLTHRNVVANLLQWQLTEGKNFKSGKDRILSVLPFYHIYGLTCLIHQPLHLGIETIVMPSFSLPLFCSTIQTQTVTYSYVAPPIVLHLAKSPLVANYDLSSLRMLTSGAAPLTKALILEVHTRLNIPIKQAYGLSETSPLSHMQPWDSSWKTKIGSIGRLVPGMECRCVDIESGKDVVSPGQEGELWLRGPNVFKGYHANEAATKACLTPDGWFQTGDIAYADDEGNYFISDRLKELIKYKGSQVAPAELEGVLIGHADVRDVAIVGRYVEEVATEVPVGFVVLAEGAPRNERKARELIEWLAQRTSGTKRLRGGVVFVDEVPKSPSGKILRRVLKERLGKGGGGGEVVQVLGAVDYGSRAKL